MHKELFRPVHVYGAFKELVECSGVSWRGTVGWQRVRVWCSVLDMKQGAGGRVEQVRDTGRGRKRDRAG